MLYEHHCLHPPVQHRNINCVSKCYHPRKQFSSHGKFFLLNSSPNLYSAARVYSWILWGANTWDRSLLHQFRICSSTKSCQLLGKKPSFLRFSMIFQEDFWKKQAPTFLDPQFHSSGHWTSRISKLWKGGDDWPIGSYCGNWAAKLDSFDNKLGVSLIGI